jgi:hypothetical protein
MGKFPNSFSTLLIIDFTCSMAASSGAIFSSNRLRISSSTSTAISLRIRSISTVRTDGRFAICTNRFVNAALVGSIVPSHGIDKLIAITNHQKY